MGTDMYIDAYPTAEWINDARLYQSQLQLLTGWFVIPDVTIRFELASASARSGIDIEGTDIFYIPYLQE